MVKCNLCERLFKSITNSHLKKAHGIDLEDYLDQFPGATLISDDIKAHLSKAMLGKNVGNKRPDVAKYMTENNPMQNKKVAKKMSKTRRLNIIEGKYNPIDNLKKSITDNEKLLIKWFKRWEIPLEYAKDDSFMIEGHTPDFINKDKKIILELVLSASNNPRKGFSEKENAYIEAGYRVIWLTHMDRAYVKKWVFAAFKKFKTRPVKINRIWNEHLSLKKKSYVYNIEVEPNNTYVANNIVVHNCFANAFRASLYTAFYDNSKTMGFRHANPDYYKKEMDKMGKYRLLPMEAKKELQGINKAFALNIPLRLGIRFEDFLNNEKKEGISLAMLQYLSDIEYPVMINTKAALIGNEAYIKALAGNKAKAAVHVTLISADNDILKRLEPGAPSYDKRLIAMKNMVDAGIRVVARIEPYLFLVTDAPEMVEKYMDDVWNTGVRNITFDTYSYTALNPGIRQSIMNAGFDFDRIFLAGCDSQSLGSLLLGSFMELFREYGFSCSTFDMGNSPTNNQSNCCEVGDWFEGNGMNYGSTVMAARFIKENESSPVTWKMFDDYVELKGGFLSPDLKLAVKELWNLGGNAAYSHSWATGLTAVGTDENGLIWRWDADKEDYRLQILNNLL